MKTNILIAMVLCVVVTRPSFAVDKVELFADEGRTSCQLADQGGMVTLHVFLTGPDAATLAGFRARVPDCWSGATWVSDQTDYVSIGTSQGEWSVAFGQCLTPPVHVGAITISTSGIAPSCCQMTIEQPVSFPLQIVDCGFAEVNAAVGQSVTINPTANCQCLLPVAVQPGTWGSVKALYR